MHSYVREEPYVNRVSFATVSIVSKVRLYRSTKAGLYVRKKGDGAASIYLASNVFKIEPAVFFFPQA